MQGVNLCLLLLSSTQFVLLFLECPQKEGRALHNGRFKATADLRLSLLAKKRRLGLAAAKRRELELVVRGAIFHSRSVSYQGQAYISCSDACAGLLVLLLALQAAILFLINLKHIQVVA